MQGSAAAQHPSAGRTGDLLLSTAWNAHRHQDGLALAREARDMGFHGVALAAGTAAALIPGLLQAAEKGIGKVGCVEIPCAATVKAGDNDRPPSFAAGGARQALDAARQGLQLAAELGAERVQIHLGAVLPEDGTRELLAMALQGGLHGRPYVKRKLALVEERQRAAAAVMRQISDALAELLSLADMKGMRIGLAMPPRFEHAPTLAEMGQLLADFQDARLGVWHHFGNVQRQANLGFLDHHEVLELCAPRLIGCTIQDLKWPDEEGRIPFSENAVDFTGLMRLVPAEAPLVWELHPKQKRLQIIAAREEWEKRFGGV